VATKTLTNPQTWPSGTSVKAYLSEDLPHPPSGVPNATAVDTQSANASGSVTFAGLADDTDYFAYALVNSEHRYIQFRSDPAVGSSVGFSLAQLSVTLPHAVPDNTIVEVASFDVEAGIYLIAGGMKFTGSMDMILQADPPDIQLFFDPNDDGSGYRAAASGSGGGFGGDTPQPWIAVFGEPSTITLSAATDPAMGGGNLTQLALAAIPLG
jgi:hypothetical protein